MIRVRYTVRVVNKCIVSESYCIIFHQSPMNIKSGETMRIWGFKPHAVLCRTTHGWVVLERTAWRRLTNYALCMRCSCLIDWVTDTDWHTKAAAGAMWRQRVSVVPAGVEDETVSVYRVEDFRKPTTNNSTHCGNMSNHSWPHKAPYMLR